MKKPVLLILAVTVTLAFGMFVLKEHIVRRVDRGADLLWDRNEAYLFLRTGILGWRLNHFQALMDRAFASFPFAFHAAKDVRDTLIVFNLTLHGVTQSVLEGIGPPGGGYCVFEGRIYDGPQWRWSGTHFDATLADEQRRFRAGRSPYGEFTNVKGWSHRIMILNRGEGETRFPLEIGGQHVELIATVMLKPMSKSLDLQRHSQPRQRLWHLEGRAQSVSRAEYKKLMKF